MATGDCDRHLDVEVLDTLGDIPLIHTDQLAWIELETDGKVLWIQVQRAAPGLKFLGSWQESINKLNLHRSGSR
jgi:hypothetical protein